MKAGLAALLLVLCSVQALAREPARNGESAREAEPARGGECAGRDVEPYRGPLFDAMFEMDENEPAERLVAVAHHSTACITLRCSPSCTPRT